jgi:hypothetical protein
MARFKAVPVSDEYPDGLKPFTAEEEAARDAEEAAWTAGQTARDALVEIERLEAFITPRRLREALLGNAEAIAFIQGVEDDIAIERAKL